MKFINHVRACMRVIRMQGIYFHSFCSSISLQIGMYTGVIDHKIYCDQLLSQW
jgi:hypothetical protein